MTVWLTHLCTCGPGKCTMPHPLLTLAQDRSGGMPQWHVIHAHTACSNQHTRLSASRSEPNLKAPTLSTGGMPSRLQTCKGMHTCVQQHDVKLFTILQFEVPHCDSVYTRAPFELRPSKAQDSCLSMEYAYIGVRCRNEGHYKLCNTLHTHVHTLPDFTHVYTVWH